MRSITGGLILATFMGSVLFAGCGSPAFATEYWVKYDYTTHQCSIVEVKSRGKETAANGGEAAAKNTTSVAPVTPTMLPPNSAPAKVTAVITQPGAPNDGTKPAAPVTTPARPVTAPGKSAAAVSPPGTPKATSSDDNTRDPTAALAAAWARNKAAAEAAGTANVTTALIGTAMASRQDAESEMQIMRKCGLAP